MFSKLSKLERAVTGSSAEARSPANRVLQKPAMPSILAPDIRITGDIKGDGDLHIEGPVDGNVRAEFVAVGPDGHVTGSIKADRVVVAGMVDGDIKAEDVTFKISARVRGTVTITEAFEVERGARFNGKTIWNEKEADKASPVASAAETIEKSVPAPAAIADAKAANGNGKSASASASANGNGKATNGANGSVPQSKNGQDRSPAALS